MEHDTSHVRDLDVSAMPAEDTNIGVQVSVLTGRTRVKAAHNRFEFAQIMVALGMRCS